MNNYLKRILNARVYDVAVESPLERAPLLSGRMGHNLYLKREDMQSVFSFKLRGAYNKMVNLPEENIKKGVICASAGNHAQGVALAAKRLGCRAMIVMPVTTPPLKVDAVRAHGAEVVLHGDNFTDTYGHAKTLEDIHGLTFVHPFDDPDVIAGQGTIGAEILRQHEKPMHAIFVPIGGGGLAAGVAAYVKQLRPEIKVIGVETVDSNAMQRSLAAGEPVTLPEVGLFADGTAVRLVGEETFRVVNAYLDEIILVDNDAVCAAIKDVFQDTRSILEPSGALAIAGAKAYAEREKTNRLDGEVSNLVAIASGANMNFDRLRFVAERSLLGEAREAVFAVTIPEESGSFRRFSELLGARSITEFNYRISDEKIAHVFVGLDVANRQETKAIINELEGNGFKVLDLSDDELGKQHVRHMVGGKSALAQDERLYRFEFPERPGALMRFLSQMAPNWNISLFHYRNQGADFGRVLVGLQVPQTDEQAFQTFLSALGYPCWNETDNPVYQLFLG